MGSQYRYEKNSMRKSHRMNIPLRVIINNEAYDVLNWSLTGISVASSDNATWRSETSYPAILQLGLQGATVSLKIQLKYVHSKKNRIGFEYLNLSEKSKKTLRHYMELHLDGKLDSVDNLIALHHEPEFESDLTTPLKLDEQEKAMIQKSFFRNSVTSLLYMLMLVVAIGAVTYYNLRYSYKGVASVEGNYQKIYPKTSQIIEEIYVKAMDKVHKNDVMADLSDEEISYQLKLLTSIRETKLQEQKIQEDLYASMNTPNNDTTVLQLKQQMVSENHKMYTYAKVQYENHLITLSQLQDYKKRYLASKEALEIYKNQSMNSKILRRPVQKVINVEESDLQIANTKRQMEQLRIFSPEDATVYEVHQHTGDLSDKRVPMFTLWTHDVPKILCTIDAKEAVNIKIGGDVEIVDMQNGHTYAGNVQQIKSNSTEMVSGEEMQREFDKVVVVIKPEAKSNALAPHSVVEVLFKRDLKFEI